MAALLFGLNLAKLHLGHVTGGKGRTYQDLAVVWLCLLFPALLAAVSEPVFAVGVVSSPAQILDVLKSLQNIVGRVALAVLLFFLRLMRMVPKQDAGAGKPRLPPVVPKRRPLMHPAGWIKLCRLFVAGCSGPCFSLSGSPVYAIIPAGPLAVAAGRRAPL